MNRRILIVEDESSIADTISYVLENEGFESVWCSTGGEARKLLATDDMALIILDIGLPDVNGLDFCRELRRETDVPIIFLTARSDEIDRIVGLELGADDYVTKPFSPRELAARVKAILRRIGVSPEYEDKTSAAVANGAFSIDRDKLRITCRGKLLKLARYEYRIMEILLSHPGRIYSRRQLMEQGWEEPDTAMERTVDAHIKSLRSKLKEIVPDKELIVTHRGFGYSLAENS